MDCRRDYVGVLAGVPHIAADAAPQKSAAPGQLLNNSKTHRTRTIDFAEKALLRLHDQRSKCARPNTLGHGVRRAGAHNVPLRLVASETVSQPDPS